MISHVKDRQNLTILNSLELLFLPVYSPLGSSVDGILLALQFSLSFGLLYIIKNKIKTRGCKSLLSVTFLHRLYSFMLPVAVLMSQ